MQALKARHVPNIIAADTNPSRQAAAATAGATHFVNPLDGNLEAKCAELCPDSNGPHVAFDTAGKQVTLDQCIAAICTGGTVMNVAVWGGTATIMPNAFLLGEKRYMGTAVYTREDFDEVIQAIASGECMQNTLTKRVWLTDVCALYRSDEPCIPHHIPHSHIAGCFAWYLEASSRPRLGSEDSGGPVKGMRMSKAGACIFFSLEGAISHAQQAVETWRSTSDGVRSRWSVGLSTQRLSVNAITVLMNNTALLL